MREVWASGVNALNASSYGTIQEKNEREEEKGPEEKAKRIFLTNKWTKHGQLKQSTTKLFVTAQKMDLLCKTSLKFALSKDWQLNWF
jgi:hypothetical protein